MALLITPANNATHKHTQLNANVFQWNNTNPYVPTVTNWRLKIGNAPFGYTYYNGTQVPYTQLWDDRVNLNLNGPKCYATVEWSSDGGITWSNGGTYTYFYCKP